LKKFAFALCAVAAMAGYSQAGIFRKRVTTVTAVQAKPAPAQVKGDTSTAQNAAIFIVQSGRFRHNGHPAGLFEGIGMGATPQQAIQNCCFWGRREAVDIGTCQKSNGTWIAVVRYR